MKKTLAFLTLLSSIILLPAAFVRADDVAPAPTTGSPAKAQGQVNRRLRRQHRRIKQGVKSGSLTKGEAKELRQHDRAIHSEEKEMRKEDGGKLTTDDKQKLNQELNQNSKDIAGEKHDAETR